jgi:thioester reductase-like protein
MNLTEQYLGQSDRIYRKLQHRVTDIIHLAWKMDFNQTIKQFEHDCIYGLYNLLKLANENNMQFHFISSISSASSGLLTTVKEEPLPRQPQIALPQGYAQSKYIAEHLCWTANKYWSKFKIYFLAFNRIYLFKIFPSIFIGLVKSVEI